MKIIASLMLLCVVSCAGFDEFQRGFLRESAKQAVEIGVEALDAKLGDKIDGLSGKLADLPKPPSGPGAEDLTLWGALGALAAYVLGSLGKGYVRKHLGKNGGA